MIELIQTIKRAAIEAVEERAPTSIVYGIVTNINPLEVNVEQRFILSKDFLIVPNSLTEYKINVNGSEYIIRDGLKAGDNIILLKCQGGQQYIILDKVAKV